MRLLGLLVGNRVEHVVGLGDSFHPESFGVASFLKKVVLELEQLHQLIVRVLVHVDGLTFFFKVIEVVRHRFVDDVKLGLSALEDGLGCDSDLFGEAEVVGGL